MLIQFLVHLGRLIDGIAMNKVIITAALVGSTSTKANNPNIPISPKEIIQASLEAHDAGASVVHIHVRDPKTGIHSNELSLFEEVCEGIRSRSPLVINLTTSYGATLIMDDNGRVNDKMSILLSPEKRIEHVLTLKPELCSLDIASLNFGPRIFANYTSVVDQMALLLKNTQTKPEIELFDLGHVEAAKKMIQKKLITGQPHFQLCMGTNGGMAATPEIACHIVKQLPKPCTWSMFGIGKAQFPMVAMSVLLGGHVRVGLEDNLYVKKGIKAKSSAELVAKATRIIENLDFQVADVEESLEILNIRR